MDYVKVYWYDGTHEYYENDTLCSDGIYRNAYLINNCFRFKRMKRLARLPENKNCVKYFRHNKTSKDFKFYATDN